MKEVWKKSNIPTMLLAIVLSLSLWTTVQLGSGKMRQETIANVPVRILEESTLKTNTGFSVIEGHDATIRVDYEAIGASVAELNKRNMEDIYAEVSVGAITEPGRTKVRYTLRYPDNLNISVRNTTPRLVEVWVDEVVSREIPVEPYTEGNPAEGYIYNSLTPDQETVTVQGPAQSVGLISYARATLAAEGVTGSFSDIASITFVDMEGNLLDAEANHLELLSGDVNLSLSVLKEGIVPLRVNVTEAPGISAGMAKIDVQPSTVKVRGDPVLVDRLANEGITIGTIDLNRMSEGGIQTLAIRTPNGVSRAAGEPNAAEVRVTIEGVASRTVEVSDIEVDLGAAEGWDAILVSGAVPVTVRGPAQLVENFDEDRLHARAAVDLDAFTQGIHPARLEVTLDGADGIAVIDTPDSVNVMLRRASNAPVVTGGDDEPAVPLTGDTEEPDEPVEPATPTAGDSEVLPEGTEPSGGDGGTEAEGSAPSGGSAPEEEGETPE